MSMPTNRIPPRRIVAVLVLATTGVFLASLRTQNFLTSPANAADPEKGKVTYQATCAVCHGAGVAGAPKFGDQAAWSPRIAAGSATLKQHALKGMQGKTGVMPPKGGNPGLNDDDVKAAVDYMVKNAK